VSRTGKLLAASVAVLACVLCFIRFGAGVEAVEASFFAAVLVALAAIDVERHVLPNRIVLPAIAVLAAAELARDPSSGWRRLAWGAGAFGVLLALALLYPPGLGMGDVKLAFLLGVGLGRSVVAAALVALLGAGLLGIGVLVRHGGAGRKVAIPLGSFLALGALVVLLAVGPR
jgi:leader peptidase (prepilin peptidase)/N-methyltransferase